MAIEMTPTQIQKADFPASRKGYDQDAVRAHLRDAAAALESALRRAKVAEDQVRRLEEGGGQPQESAPAVSQDQQVADETARVLMAAREAAASVEEQGRESADQIVVQAQQQAAQLSADAEARARQIIEEAEAKAAQIVGNAEQAQAAQAAQAGVLADANAQAEAIISEANANAVRILDDAKAKADTLLAQAELEVESKKTQLEEKRQSAIQELEVKRQKALEEIEQRKAELIEIRGESPGKKPLAKKARPSGPVKTSGPVRTGSGKVAAEDVPEGAPARRPKAKPAAAKARRDSGEVPAPPKAGRDSGEVPAGEDGKDFEQLFGRFQEGQESEVEETVEAAPMAQAAPVQTAAPAPAMAETVEMRSPVSASPDITLDEAPSGLSMELPATDAAALDLPDEANSKVLDVLKKQLLRKLKRGLQDEQNQVLEALRQSGGGPAAAQSVPQAADSLRRVRKTIDPVLQEISKLGWSTAGGTGPAPAVHAVDETINGYLVSPLSGQLGQAISEGQQAGEDVAVLADRIGNVYRTWKGPELAELAARLANEAFMSGRGAVAS